MHCELCSAVTLHCVLLSQFNIQTTAAKSTPLNTCNTFTFTNGADIDRRPTADQPHSTQFPVLTAVTQFECTGTDILV